MRSTAGIICLVLVTTSFHPDFAAAVPAFSGAEGFGAITPGGRGGSVIHVTNLNDSGPGSFRAAVTASGPRTVVFDVSGQIDLNSRISILNPYLTIAGQTAPGDGITIAGGSVSIDIHDVIVRYVRFRRGSVTPNEDSLSSDRTNSNNLQDPKTGNIIVDHVSASWGLDENMSIYRSKLDAPLVPGGSTVLPTRNVTIQWSISSEALNPNRHAFGSTLGGAGVNHHHNLWASNTGRNPSISFSDFMDFRNNVLFNWMHRSVDGAGPEAHVNMINNYYKPGPATGFSNGVTPQPTPEIKVNIVNPELRDGPPYTPATIGDWYVNGNFVEGYPEVSADNWEGESEVAPGVFARGVQFEDEYPVEWARVASPITHVQRPNDPDDPFDGPAGPPLPIPDLPVIATQSAQAAFQSVLAGAGSSLVRDAVDQRVIQSVATGIATAGPRGDGIINHPNDVGGYPNIPTVTRDATWDTDQDGMPDTWELDHGLAPNSAADRNDDFDTDGFTNLEEYLGDVGAFKAVEDVVWDGGNGRYAQIENWNIAFQPSRFDTAVIHNGAVVVDAVGQQAGTLRIAPSTGDTATLNISSGWLAANDAVVIGGTPTAQGTLNLIGGMLSTPLLSKGEASTLNFTGGTLHADVVDFDLVNNGGTIAPGHSPGLSHIDGDLILNSGTLEIEIGGKLPAQYDRLLVDGIADLGGTLSVTLVDLGSGVFVPQAGDSFGFLAAFGGAGGHFDAFDLPALPPGLAWRIGPGDVTVFLNIVAIGQAGDYDNDGSVDAADYVVWRNALGTHLPLANETASPGNVDQDDYNIWRANFGATPASGTAMDAAVPEPGSIILALFAAAILATLCRRTAQLS